MCTLFVQLLKIPVNLILGSKAESFGARTSHTDMDHPDRLLTPPIPSQSNDVSREKTL